jgi:hypothetical protein
MLKYKWPVRCCFLLLLLAVVAAPAMAQTTAQSSAQNGIGVVAGISASPDQFYFGANWMAAKVATNFWFRPGAEVGVGNSQTVVGINGEFIYLVDIHKSPWSAYFGGGPALMIDTVHNDPPLSNTTNVGGGFNFLAGIRKSKGIFSEIKVGLADSPAFKFGIGYTF